MKIIMKIIFKINKSKILTQKVKKKMTNSNSNSSNNMI